MVSAGVARLRWLVSCRTDEGWNRLAIGMDSTPRQWHPGFPHKSLTLLLATRPKPALALKPVFPSCNFKHKTLAVVVT